MFLQQLKSHIRFDSNISVILILRSLRNQKYVIIMNEKCILALHIKYQCSNISVFIFTFKYTCYYTRIPHNISIFTQHVSAREEKSKHLIFHVHMHNMHILFDKMVKAVILALFFSHFYALSFKRQTAKKSSKKKRDCK